MHWANFLVVPLFEKRIFAHISSCFLFQEDKVWEWDRLFTEVASQLQTEWEQNEAGDAVE